jgi:hypothetical protein
MPVNAFTGQVCVTLDFNARTIYPSGEASNIWKWHWTNSCAMQFTLRYELKDGTLGDEVASPAGNGKMGEAGFISSPCGNNCGGIAHFEVDCPANSIPGVAEIHLRENFSHVAAAPPKPDPQEQARQAAEQDAQRAAEQARQQNARNARDKADQRASSDPGGGSSQAPTCFRNSRYGMSIQGSDPYFVIVCLDPNKSDHWANDPLGEAPNGDRLATAGPAEFKMLMRNCLSTPTEYSCPECCQPIR